MPAQTTPVSPNPPVPDTERAVPAQTPVAFSPLYKQIKALIVNGMHAGEWRPGEPIPSEMELASRYQVSQGTVRKAIDELATENLLLRRQGKGTFVATHAEQKVRFRFLKLVPDHGERGSEGPATRRIVDCKSMRAPPDVARALALQPGASVLLAKRVLSFGGVPVVLEDIWLPAAQFKGLSAERLSNHAGPMYALFETEFNIRMVRADEKIRAVSANEAQQALLNVGLGSPLLFVERVAFTYRDQPMELRRGFYRTDAHHYHNTLG